MVKLGEWIMILELHRQGLSISAIAECSGLDRKTVRKYIARGLEAPAYGPRRKRGGLLDRFTGYRAHRQPTVLGMGSAVSRRSDDLSGRGPLGASRDNSGDERGKLSPQECSQ